MNPTIELFNEVDQHGRANLIHDHGEFLLTREYYARKVNLYAMPGYYAEIIYNPDQNKIEEIRAIKSDSQEVDKYLPYIKIVEI